MKYILMIYESMTRVFERCKSNLILNGGGINGNKYSERQRKKTTGNLIGQSNDLLSLHLLSFPDLGLVPFFLGQSGRGQIFVDLGVFAAIGVVSVLSHHE